MKVFKIDARDHVITEETCNGDLQDIYRIGGFDCVDAVQISSGDTIYVDDEGLLKNPTDFFSVPGYLSPLAGNGVVLGIDVWGEDTPAPKITIDELKRSVLFWTRIGDTLHLVGSHAQPGDRIRGGRVVALTLSGANQEPD